MSRKPKTSAFHRATPPRKKSRSSYEQMLYGILPVQQALQHQRRKFEKLYLKEDAFSAPRFHTIIQLSKRYQVAVELLPPAKLDDLCPDHPHQGALLKCGPLPHYDEAVFQTLVIPEPQLFVALDQVEDPHNLGAIIRSCGFFNVAAVITGQAHFCGITPAVSKTSAGVAEYLPIITVPNLTRFLISQKKRNFWIAGLDGEASQSLTTLSLEHSLILVAGNEGKGLHRLVKETCDWLVQIPGNPEVAALNVSNAVAVALYHLNHFV